MGVLLAFAGHAADARAAFALPAAVSLADELAAALKAGHPLVVMASLAGCPFCETVRNGYLGPMHARDGLPVVQIDTGSAAALRDFQRNFTTHAEQLKAWRVRVTPTVLFFGPGGREVVPRLVGASIPDFYGAYLEERIAAARKQI